MTYDYALDFTPVGVRLLKGSGKDQVLLGEVALDDPHFETRLEDLRKEVEEETGEPLSPAILIPHSEILFHTMNLEEEDDAAREARVRAELDGLTPYRVEDLVYDWKAISKTQIQVAAVARDTLAEADSFAARNGFGPGPFATHPKPGAFRGQPSFGESSRPPLPPFPKPEPEPEPEPEIVAPEPQDVALPVFEEISEAGTATEDTAPAGDASTVGEFPLADPATDQPLSAEATPDQTPSPAQEEEPRAPEAEPTPKPDAAPEAPLLIDDFAEISPTRQPLSPLSPSETSPRSARRGYVPPGRQKADASAESAEPSGATTDRVPPAAFTSRRQSETAVPESRLGSIASRIAMLPDGGAGPTVPPVVPPLPNGVGAGIGAAAGVASGAAAGAAVGAASKPPSSFRPGAKPGASGAKPGAPGPQAPTPTVRKVQAPDAIAGGAAQSLGSATAGTTRSRDGLSEAEALTVFGMREPVQSRFAPYLPIAIGLVAALLLALVVWFAFLRGEDEAQETAALPVDQVENPAPPQVAPTGAGSEAADSAPAAVVEEDVAAAEPESEALAEAPAEPAAEVETIVAEEPAAEVQPAEAAQVAQAEEAPAELAAAATVEEDTPAAAAAEPVDPDLAPGPNDPLRRSPDAPETTRYAATGVLTQSPTGTTALPAVDTAQTTPVELADGTIRALDGIVQPSLPDPATLLRPAPLIPPPPPGSTFDLGPDGRVVATAEGALSPQGVRITAGRPPVTPPQAPDRPAGEPAEPDAQATEVTSPEAPAAEIEPTVPVTEGQPEATPPVRPEGLAPETDDQAALTAEDQAAQVVVTAVADGFAGPVPQPRPVTEAAAAAASDEAPAAEPDPRLAGFTPRARPQIATDATPEVATITPEDSAAEAEAVAVALAAIIPEAAPEPESPYAVDSSRRPGARPGNFIAQVEEAQPVQVAAAAATVTPRNPTAGSVASRATQDNVIRLNRVNLIGVYGTQSNRRALVRLPSGRFVKVKVGDQVDGGRVRAIEADRLQYVKGGRALILTIPQG